MNRGGRRNRKRFHLWIGGRDQAGGIDVILRGPAKKLRVVLS